LPDSVFSNENLLYNLGLGAANKFGFETIAGNKHLSSFIDNLKKALLVIFSKNTTVISFSFFSDPVIGLRTIITTE